MKEPDISIIVLKGLKSDMGKKMVSGKKPKEEMPEKKKSTLKDRLEKIRS